MTKEQRDYLDLMADAKNRQRLTPFEQRCLRACLAQLDAAEKVVTAARAKHGYEGMEESLLAYDEVRGQS